VSQAPLALPEDLDALRDLALRQQTELAEQAEQIRWLEEYVRLLRHQRFGRRSEQGEGDTQQGRLFNEAEATQGEEAAAEESEPETIPVEGHARRKHGRRPLPAWIPRLEILHDLSEAEKVCAADGAALVRIGEEVSEQLELVPATVRVLRHVRAKYACPACKTGVHVAPLPPQPIPKSLASPALLAHIAVSKYADGLPLYRQETMLQRGGIDLPRATLAGWMRKAGVLVQPLVNLLRDELLGSGFVQCDETRFQVLKEPGKPATSQSYLWAQRGGRARRRSCSSTTTPRAAARCRSGCSKASGESSRRTATRATPESAADPASRTWAAGRMRGGASSRR
jgi:transposase